MRRTSVLPQAKPRRRGGFADPEHYDRLRKPKKRHDFRRVSFLVRPKSDRGDAPGARGRPRSPFPRGRAPSHNRSGSTMTGQRPAALLRRTSVLPQAKPRRRGGFADPEHYDRLRKPKKRHDFRRVSFLVRPKGLEPPTFRTGSSTSQNPLSLAPLSPHVTHFPLFHHFFHQSHPARPSTGAGWRWSYGCKCSPWSGCRRAP